jgi:hypothetical protein
MKSPGKGNTPAWIGHKSSAAPDEQSTLNAKGAPTSIHAPFAALGW